MIEGRLKTIIPVASWVLVDDFKQLVGLQIKIKYVPTPMIGLVSLELTWSPFILIICSWHAGYLCV